MENTVLRVNQSDHKLYRAETTTSLNSSFSSREAESRETGGGRVLQPRYSHAATGHKTNVAWGVDYYAVRTNVAQTPAKGYNSKEPRQVNMWSELSFPPVSEKKKSRVTGNEP
jgi:hypothetical protein